MKKTATKTKKPILNTSVEDEIEQVQDVENTPDPVIEAVELAVQDIENALYNLELAREKAVACGRDVMRIVGAKQRLTEVLKDIKPIIEG